MTKLKALINVAFIDGVHDNQPAAALIVQKKSKVTMNQKEALKKEKKESETNLNGNVIVPRYDCVTSHTARSTGITNMYLTHKYSIVQMIHVTGYKTQKTFMAYTRLSSDKTTDEIADEIDAIANGTKSEVF